MRFNFNADDKGHPLRTLSLLFLTIVTIAAAAASGSAFAYAYSITNLTNYSSGMSASNPSLNDNGQVAWSVFFNSNDIDLFVDGINHTPGTPNQFNGIPSLNELGQVAWLRWDAAPGTDYDIILGGLNLTASTNSHVFGPSLNNLGQVAWSQYTTEWDVLLGGVNLTVAMPGSAQGASLNDSGQVAWQQHYDGQRDIYLDGINLTPAIDGEAYNPSLNNLGQVAWMQWTGSEFDVFLDGVNLSSGIPGDVQQVSLNDLGQVAWWQFNQGEFDVFLDGVNLTDWTSEAAFHPSLNNRGQVAWDMGRDIYLATPVPEPPTLALLGLGFLGFVSLRRVNSARCLILKCLKQASVMAKPSIAVTFLVVMLSVALLPNYAFAGVYKCKDAKGKVTYSDTPCQNQATQQSVDKRIQYENSAAGRQAAAINKSEAEIRKIQAQINTCNSAVDEYLDMLGARASKGALTRQEKDVTAICGRNELLARGIVKPEPPPAPVVINQGSPPSPPPPQFCKVNPNGTLFCF